MNLPQAPVASGFQLWLQTQLPDHSICPNSLNITTSVFWVFFAVVFVGFFGLFFFFFACDYYSFVTHGESKSDKKLFFLFSKALYHSCNGQISLPFIVSQLLNFSTKNQHEQWFQLVLSHGRFSSVSVWYSSISTQNNAEDRTTLLGL